MRILQLLLWALIGWIAFKFLRQQLNHPKNGENPSRPNPTSTQMVRCHVCGLHVPQHEAVLAQGRYYCCDDHRRRDATP